MRSVLTKERTAPIVCDVGELGTTSPAASTAAVLIGTATMRKDTEAASAPQMSPAWRSEAAAGCGGAATLLAKQGGTKE